MHNSVMSQFVPDCDAPHFPLVLLVHTPSPSTRRFRRSTKKRDGGSSPASLFVDAAGGSRRMHLPGSIYLLLVGGNSFFCPKHLVWKKVRKGAVFGGWFFYVVALCAWLSTRLYCRWTCFDPESVPAFSSSWGTPAFEAAVANRVCTPTFLVNSSWNTPFHEG